MPQKLARDVDKGSVHHGFVCHTSLYSDIGHGEVAAGVFRSRLGSIGDAPKNRRCRGSLYCGNLVSYFVCCVRPIAPVLSFKCF
jgi:hypothetical protein